MLALLIVIAASTIPAAHADPGILDITPAHLNFGKVVFDRSKKETITLTNTSSGAVLVDLETVNVPDDFSPGQPESTCTLYADALLAADESCTHIVGFDPDRIFTGHRTALLGATVKDPATGAVLETDEIRLSGRGVEPSAVASAALETGLLRAAPPHVEFGVRQVGTFTLKGTMITNTSDRDISLLVEGYSLPDNFSFGLWPGSTCPALGAEVLAAGASCNAVVGFRPEEFWIGIDQTAALQATAFDSATGAIVDTLVIEFYGRARA